MLLGLNEKHRFVKLVVIEFEDLAKIYYLLYVFFEENHNCPYFVNQRPDSDRGVLLAVSRE